MVTIGRGWSCAATCGPTSPCYGPGCPNARQAFRPNPYSNPGVGHRPTNYPNPPPSWRRWNSAPPRPGPQAYPNPSWNPNRPGGAVRIGVGNVSDTDIDIDVRDNFIWGGRRRVDIGSGNHAARSNMGVIANNSAVADDLMIGADNYSRGGDNNIRVMGTDFSGYGRIRIGSGNYAGGSNRIVVDGLGSDIGGRGSNGPPQGGQRRRRWWLF